MRYLILILGCFFLFNSCEPKDAEKYSLKENRLTLTKCYGDSVREVIELNNDTIKDGYTNIYHNNILSRKVLFKNGELHGMDSFYFKSGNPKQVLQWAKGNPIYGLYRYYDEKQAVVVGINDRDTIMLRPKIKEYSFFDYDQKINFSSVYDQSGIYTKTFGSLIVHVILSKENLVLNEPLKISYFVALPPLTEPDFIIEVERNGSSIKKYNGSIDRDYNIVDFEFTPNTHGMYEILAYYKLINNDVVIDIDTAALSFNLKPK